ncbi:MAG: crossover junction endodeoxyribonuclease RuvC [Nitrospiraceae bacterium]|nr:crossover junction endodeoxyribonuclease RuvC [Nitrospiraceae bacterium]
MRVLGIDPGLSRCGYGVVDSGPGAGDRIVSAGLIQTAPSAPLGERLAEFLSEMTSLISDYRPDVAVVERILFRKNAKTAFGVVQVVGLVHLACHQGGVAVREYSAAEVKLAVAGHGAASKFQVQRMVQLIGDLPSAPEPPDVADAVALALCHLANMRGGGGARAVSREPFPQAD